MTGYLYVSREGFGYLRSVENSLASTSKDVFVPATLIKRYGLRPGCEVQARTTRKSKRRQVSVIEAVEGRSPERYSTAPHFKKLTSIDPKRRINLETKDHDLSLRLIDLVTPLGFGQRALIAAPPRTGKTVILHKLARAIATNHPEAELIVMLVDERPEEVTDVRRTVPATVLASTFDEPTTKHVEIVEMCLEVVRRKVEASKDVVLLVDSLTRIGRAFNIERGNSRRTLTGGLDATAMTKPRELFGAARNTDKGSLTIIASALIKTGSAMDTVIFEEFKGTGNSELVLNRKLADDRVFPAIDVTSSATRREEKLRTKEEMHRINMIRRMLVRGKPVPAMQGLLKQMKPFSTNAEFLMSLPV